MSIRIALDHQPEFYTNLDHVTGRIMLRLNRSEQIGSIVVKLEGESITALQVPNPYDNEAAERPPGPLPGPPGSMVSENHKILYRVQQVFPDEYHSSASNPYGAFPLQPGEHEFPFKFKLPINNACSDPNAMAKIGGIAGVGGFGSGGGLFGMGGVRVMDGSKQLYLKHVTRTLPPSLTGYPMEAEIRYYIKVTVQRPGLLKENWRYQIGYKFLPIEPPRAAVTGQEAFARRPFKFRPRSPSSLDTGKKKSSLFSKKSEKAPGGGSNGTASDSADVAPSIEMSARLPHPSILTCNKPIPLRLIAKKLVNCPEQVFLTSLEIDLVGVTEVRSHNIHNKKVNQWVVFSATSLSIQLTKSADAEVGSEVVVPDDLWRNKPLPNTVAPSFVTCNLSRRYELEIKIGLSWGKPKTGFIHNQPQSIFLPLHFSSVEVFSGITPPAELVEAASSTNPGRATLNFPPRLPPRINQNASSPSGSQQPAPQQQESRPPPMPQRPAQDPLYPPQLAPGQSAPPYDEAPPSYDEAIAENLSGPFDGLQSRPAYSGVTNENAPSQMPPEKG